MVLQADRNTATSAVAVGRGVADRNPDMMRSPEAALYIDMSDSWLRQTRMAGRTNGPPFLRQGRAIRYRRCDLDCWLERRLCGGGMEQLALAPFSALQPKPQCKPPRRGMGGSRRSGQ